MQETIWYAGKKMKLDIVYDEEKYPKWADEAQDRINDYKEDGESACCIHEGNLHGFYIEHPDQEVRE